MQGSRYRRTRIGTDPTDDVGMIVNPRGAHLLAQRGREIVLGDGEATLVSLTDTLESTHRPPGDLLVLRFPRPQLAPRLAGGDAFLRRIPHHNLALRLLTGYLDVASQRRALADRDLQPAMVSHLYDLMAVTLGATRDAAEIAQGRGLRAARLHALKQDIARNLDQADVVRAVIAPHPPVARAEQPGRQQIQTRERMYRQVDLDRGAAQGLDLVPGAPAFEELAEQTRPLVLRGLFPRETEYS
jgi:hypothetical protein